MVNLSANDLSSHGNLCHQQQRLQQNNSSDCSNSLDIRNSDRNNASSPDGHSSPSSSTSSKGGLISFRLTRSPTSWTFEFFRHIELLFSPVNLLKIGFFTLITSHSANTTIIDLAIHAHRRLR